MTLWLVIIIAAIACLIIFLPTMHKVLRGLLIAIAVILFAVWVLNLLGQMDGFHFPHRGGALP